MEKNALKYLIDVTLFIDMCAISIIGLLLGFAIPRGSVHRSGNFFIGLHRHEWGDLHLYLSVFLLLLLILHIWLNWTWVIQSSKRYFGNQWKRFLWFFSGAWLIVLFVGWLVLRFSSVV